MFHWHSSDLLNAQLGMLSRGPAGVSPAFNSPQEWGQGVDNIDLINQTQTVIKYADKTSAQKPQQVIQF